eukprot:scpid19505/ scgid5889/ Fibrillin-1; MP340
MPSAPYDKTALLLLLLLVLATSQAANAQPAPLSIFDLIKLIARRTDDPCMKGTHNCTDKQSCHSRFQNPLQLWNDTLPGRFLCYDDVLCKEGFSSARNDNNDFYCQDIEECLFGGHTCYEYRAYCINTPGSFLCECHEGYIGDGQLVCNNVDECSLGTHACHESSECVDTIGSFGCPCRTGFLGDGHLECMDLDECRYNLHNCGDPAQDNTTNCHNTPGAFRCECGPGWAGNSSGCTDIDECSSAAASSPCGAAENMQCSNTAGSFTCACADGYRLHESLVDGTMTAVCVDEDECANPHAACDANALCANIPGSYTCECKDGFSGNGHRCRSVTQRKCQVSGWGPWSNCKFACHPRRRRRHRRLLSPPAPGQVCRLVQVAVCPTLKCDYRFDYETQEYPGVVRDPSLVPVYVYTGFHPGDCEVTRWGPWSECCAPISRHSEITNSAGVMEGEGGVMTSRHRNIVRPASRHGRICPPLFEVKPCMSRKPCNNQS